MKNSMKRNIIILCCVAFVIGIGIGITTYLVILKQKIITVMGEIPIKCKLELINDASVIIRGTVNKSLPSEWSNPEGNARNLIQTDIIVDVNEVYKGTPHDSKAVTVRIDKGKVGNVVWESKGYPDFTVGEEVILFLSEDDGDLATNENYYVLTGMCQGKFSLDNSTNSATKDNSGDKVFKNFLEQDSLKLSTVKKEINDTLEYLKKNPLPRMTKEEIRKNNEKLFGK